VLAWKSRAARLQRTHLSSIKHQRIRKEGVSLAKQEQLRQGNKPAHLSSIIKHPGVEEGGVSPTNSHTYHQTPGCRRRWCWPYKPAHLSSNTRVSKKVVLALQTRTPIIKHPGVKEGGGRPTKPHTYHETPGSRGRWCWPYKPAHLSSNTRVLKKVVLALQTRTLRTYHQTPGCRRRWCWPYKPAHLSSNTRVSKKVVLAL